MTVYLTGDIHGMTDDPERFEIWNWTEGADLSKDDYLIVMGDFGLPNNIPESAGDLRALNNQPWTTLFIDGNHEDFSFLESLDEEEWHGGLAHRFPSHDSIIHLIRGEVYEIDGYTFFCMGGATSVDRKHQQLCGSWYAEELPDEFDFQNAVQNLERVGWTVDFVLTHTCANRMLDEAIGNSGLPGVGAQNDELTDWLDMLEDKLDYDHWYFGHFHQDAELDSQHTLLYQDIIELEM